MSDTLETIRQQQLQILAELKIIRQYISRQPAIVQPDQPFSVAQAAGFLGLSASTIYKLVHFKKIQPLQLKKRGRLLFTRETLLQFLQPSNK